jgi:hypothetical protein
MLAIKLSMALKSVGSLSSSGGGGGVLSFAFALPFPTGRGATVFLRTRLGFNALGTLTRLLASRRGGRADLDPGSIYSPVPSEYMAASSDLSRSSRGSRGRGVLGLHLGFTFALPFWTASEWPESILTRFGVDGWWSAARFPVL